MNTFLHYFLLYLANRWGHRAPCGRKTEPCCQPPWKSWLLVRKARREPGGSQQCGFQDPSQLQRGIRKSLLRCVSQAMSRLRELCSWEVLRSQPCRVVTIHTDYKLPTVQIKDGRCLPSFRSECKSFYHLMKYTMMGVIMGKKGKESGKQKCGLESWHHQLSGTQLQD